MAFSCCPHQGRAVPSCPQFLPSSAALANYSHPLLAFPWACGQYINVALVLPVKFITKEVSHFLCHLQSIFFFSDKKYENWCASGSSLCHRIPANTQWLLSLLGPCLHLLILHHWHSLFVVAAVYPGSIQVLHWTRVTKSILDLASPDFL